MHMKVVCFTFFFSCNLVPILRGQRWLILNIEIELNTRYFHVSLTLTHIIVCGIYTWQNTILILEKQIKKLKKK